MTKHTTIVVIGSSRVKENGATLHGLDSVMGLTSSHPTEIYQLLAEDRTKKTKCCLRYFDEALDRSLYWNPVRLNEAFVDIISNKSF